MTFSARGRPVLLSTITSKCTYVPTGGILLPNATQAAGIMNMSSPLSWWMNPKEPLSFLIMPLCVLAAKLMGCCWATEYAFVGLAGADGSTLDGATKRAGAGETSHASGKPFFLSVVRLKQTCVPTGGIV